MESQQMYVLSQITHKAIEFHFLPQCCAACALIPELVNLDTSRRLFLYGVSDFLSRASAVEQALIMDTCLASLTMKLDAEDSLSLVYPPEQWSHEVMSGLFGYFFSLSKDAYQNTPSLNKEKAEACIRSRCDEAAFALGQTIRAKAFLPADGKFLLAVMLRTWLYENNAPRDEGTFFIEYLSRFFAMECLEVMEHNMDFIDPRGPLGRISRYVWNCLDEEEDAEAVQENAVLVFGEPSPDDDPYEDEYMDVPFDIAVHYLSAAKVFMKDNGTDKLYPELYMLLDQHEKEAVARNTEKKE